MRSRIWAAVSAAVLCLTLCACSEQVSSKYVMAMDTIMEFTVYGPKGEEGIERSSQLMAQLEGLLSVTDEQSAVHQLNRAGSLSSVDGHLAALLDLALELGEQTGGALDITVYPVVKAWGFTGEEYRVPDGEELTQLLELVDWRALTWEDGTIALPEGGQIDLGSIAKGYAGMVAADELREMGVKSALLNLGGNVQTVGVKPDGSPWRIAIKDPLTAHEGGTVGVLELKDQAAVTSGGYERYFEENGQTYWHIIDPATGYPADSGLLSVTVVGENGALCDGLSTALFILGEEKALELWRTRGDFEAVLVGESGTITITAGLADAFELTGEGYTVNVAQ